MKNVLFISLLIFVSVAFCLKLRKTNCKSGELIYNGTCVENCPNGTILSDDLKTCVTNCKPGYGTIAPYWYCQPCSGRNKFKEGNQCLTSCTRLALNYDCVDSCPSNMVNEYDGKQCVERCAPGELILKEHRVCIKENQCGNYSFIINLNALENVLSIQTEKYVSKIALLIN